MADLQHRTADRIRKAARADAWVNHMTGLGTALRDNTSLAHSRFQHARRRQDLLYFETLMSEDPLAYRICHKPAQEMLRQGFRLDLGKGTANELRSAMMADWDRLNGSSNVIEAMTFARGMGTAMLFVGADDGKDLSEPLDLSAVKTVKFFKVLTNAELTPVAWQTDYEEEDFGEPVLFDVMLVSPGAAATVTVPVHASRFVRFDGIVTTTRRRAQNNGWGDSIFVQTEETVSRFWQAVQGLSNSLGDADQAVFKLKNLMDIIRSSPEGEDAVRTRLHLLSTGRSVARAIAIDADGEEFEYQSRSFQGYDDGVYALMHIVSAACGIPVSLLFGMAPAGLNATGQQDITSFYDFIKSEQVLRLLPKLRRLFEIMFSAQQGPARGVVPAEWSITFCPLLQPTPTERADIRLKTAQADQIEIDSGVITSDEARQSHYGGDEYSQDIYLDETAAPDEPSET